MGKGSRVRDHLRKGALAVKMEAGRARVSQDRTVFLAADTLAPQGRELLGHTLARYCADKEVHFSWSHHGQLRLYDLPSSW